MGRRRIRSVALAVFMAGSLLLITAGVALADCPADDTSCFRVAPDRGRPGTVVDVETSLPCNPSDEEAAVLFVQGDLLPPFDYPSAALELDSPRGETATGRFVVPDLPPGEYQVTPTCPASFLDPGSGSAPFTIDPVMAHGAAVSVPVLGVDAGYNHTCAVRRDGSIACWGLGYERGPTPLPGTFTAVNAGLGLTCALRTEGGILCWGGEDPVPVPPSGTFDSVSTGQAHACALGLDGSLACWGSDDHGQATPPGGTFSGVAAGGYHSCAIRTDGTLACWGSDDYGQATPLAGAFTAVSAGNLHTCGVRTDGTLACWGSGWEAPEDPPPGTFTAVSDGGWHACAIRADGTLACWGSDDYGQATPPGGTFTAVSAGNLHTCGVRTDGTLACWGSNEYGATSPRLGQPDTSTPGPVPGPVPVPGSGMVSLLAGVLGVAAVLMRSRTRPAATGHRR